MRIGLKRTALDGLCGPASHRRLLIFTFHRVLPEPDEFLPGEPTEASFARTIEWIGRYLKVLPLPEAAHRLTERTLPARAACITFDDGYRNNFEIARPLLEQAGLTASFFIATGAIDEGSMWNDLVIESVRHCNGRLDLTGFDLGLFDLDQLSLQDASYSKSAGAHVVATILDKIKYLDIARRAEIARGVYQMVCGNVPPDLMMSTDMIRSLSEHGFDVGAHTVTHPILAKLDDDASYQEIEASRDRVASITQRTPRTFAYPNGCPGVDFYPQHRQMVRDLGFDCAVSTQWGCATNASDPMALERFTPWEDTESGFYARLLKTCLRSWM